MTSYDWSPSKASVENANITAFTAWLAQNRQLTFSNFQDLWTWSVEEPSLFWNAFVQWAGIVFDTPASGPELEWQDVASANWFAGAKLNYVDQVLRHPAADRAAVVHQSEAGNITRLTWSELQERVKRMAAALQDLGIEPGDRVVGYLPNRPETVIAFLATASLGAIWSLCSPEMGAPTVSARFEQIEPKLIFAVSEYEWNGKTRNREDDLHELLKALPTLKHCILLSETDKPNPVCINGIIQQHDFHTLLESTQKSVLPKPQAFDAPLWILFSSGTTGAPKPIVHGHGGIVLEHLKLYQLHQDGHPGDVFSWYSSTGWVMWNAQLAGLLAGSTIALAEGAPNFPDEGRLWRLIDDQKITLFGAGAAWVTGQMQAKANPAQGIDLSSVRMIGTTGSPLPSEAYDWIWQTVNPDVWIAPISGGTDFAGAFLAGLPTLPLRKGVMQTRGLAAKVESFDESGSSLIGEVGELVCTAPMPSMPLFLWGDTEGKRLHDAYFSTYEGVWRHGDWLRLDPDGGAVIFGRSDATINRHGVRMGTADIYRVAETEAGVADSLVIDLEYLGRPSRMVLFLVMQPGHSLTDTLQQRIRNRLRAEVSPHHLPDEIIVAPDVPRTLTGKKMEVPVRKMLLGMKADQAATAGAMANPESLHWYETFARQDTQ